MIRQKNAIDNIHEFDQQRKELVAVRMLPYMFVACNDDVKSLRTRSMHFYACKAQRRMRNKNMNYDKFLQTSYTTEEYFPSASTAAVA
jgi:hypothetical protein